MLNATRTLAVACLAKTKAHVKHLIKALDASASLISQVINVRGYATVVIQILVRTMGHAGWTISKDSFANVTLDM